MDPVVHFEFPYDDRERIVKFYQSAFGRELQKLGEDMGNYVIAVTAKSDAKPGAPGGAIGGGFYKRNPDWPAQYPSVVIAVDKIVKAGGKLLGEPMDIPGVGRYVSFYDTEGNRVSILQPQPMGGPA